MNEISDLQKQVHDWVRHNFPRDNRAAVALGIAEEAGELCRAVLKQIQGIRGSWADWDVEIRKETGDVFLKLAHLAAECGFDLSSVIHARWEEISQRDWIKDPNGHGLPK